VGKINQNIRSSASGEKPHESSVPPLSLHFSGFYKKKTFFSVKATATKKASHEEKSQVL
jgi:hypothetical protein